MDLKLILKANIKRHFSGIFGVFFLIFIVYVSLAATLSVWTSSANYISSETVRTGCGDIIAWVSGLPDINPLTEEISSLDEVKNTEAQDIIFTDYEANEIESDSEGQLIKYSLDENKYKFFKSDLSGYLSENPDIDSGEVYVPTSMISMLNIKIGDEISFAIAREGGSVSLTVAGFYEDAFMGSSMIGMKGFLICEQDFESISETIANSGINSLARTGAMLHIFSAENVSIDKLNNVINEKTSLQNYAEFIHSRGTLNGFMLVLQNAFCGIITAFVIVLLAASLAVLGHSISSEIEADFSDMGILKTIGFTNKKLRLIQLLQYFIGIIPAVLLGLIFAVPLADIICSATVTTTGVLIPARLPLFECTAVFAAIIVIMAAFIYFKTKRIEKIPPIQAIQNNFSENKNARKTPALNGKNLHFSLAVKQLFSDRKRYLGACAVAVLLTFFASLTGRIYSWLGTDGKGMMDAFNPADHDIGVQSFGELTRGDFEKVIQNYTAITDTYMLAMPNVSLNGADFTANVIDEPDRFHIISGNTCNSENEIVITEFIANDMDLQVGDTVTVGSNLDTGEYVISGIYSCANDMGDNVGMSKDGYLKIGRDDPKLWCYHYFLENPDCKYDITAELENMYGGDVHVHENTWPGLFGIISAMQALVIFMYAAVIIFIFIVTVMTSRKIISAEQRDLGIFKAVGFTDNQLRVNFAARFGMTALIGAAVGIILAAFFTDPLVSAVMKLAGISNFASSPNALEIILPALIVIFLFGIFGFIAAGKIKKVDLTLLISE